uniref:Uncharacterized protein n=1 Tax=Anguilla anguilla TaxID=7936 RepID=A0A0E9TQC3_ANGAN
MSHLYLSLLVYLQALPKVTFPCTNNFQTSYNCQQHYIILFMHAACCLCLQI